MDNNLQQQLEWLKTDTQAWNQFHAGCSTEIDFSGVDLHGIDFTSRNLSKVNLSNSNLENCRFHGPMSEINLHGANLIGASFDNVNLNKANLSESNLEGASILSSHFDYAILTKAKLVNTSMPEATFGHANLSFADLSNSDIKGTYFGDANLSHSILIDVKVNSGTNFPNANVEKCKINRHTLESLKDYGLLTKGDRMQMDIIDGVATLRQTYSGFMQWIHMLALILFLYPYIWFVVKHWSIAKFVSTESEFTIPLWEALTRFIWNGGQNWEIGWDFSLITFSIFFYAFIYNVLRFILLWKTKSLELQQESSGLPPVFSLVGWWYIAYRASIYGFYINLIAVLYHTYHFMCQEIPINNINVQ